MKEARAIQSALRLAALTVTATLGCQGLLGIEDGKLRASADAGSVACKLSSDCSDGKVCLFATCSKPCNVDTDCANEYVCLATTTKAGTACVSPSQASCTTSASVCPGGTTCIGGQCQIDCSSDASVCRKDQVCSSGACVGTSPGHEPTGTGGRGGGSSGGTGGSGGASATGGQTSGGAGGANTGATDGGQGDGTAVGTPGQPCSPDGAYACKGHAQKGVLTCSNGTWSSLSPCSGNNNCDSTPGTSAGSCQPTVTECSGQSPGTTFCRNTERFQCGPDLVTAPSLETCPFVCTAGACTGECVPGATDCGGGGGAGAGLVPRTCQIDGTWFDGNACPYLCAAATGSCVAATCGDGAKNGNETDVDCGGGCGATCTVNKTCAINGDCVRPASAKCTGGKCTAAACNDGAKNGPESDVDCGGSCPTKCSVGKGCGTTGDCALSACVGAICAGVCTPGTQRCSGTGIQTCSATGTWGTAATCKGPGAGSVAETGYWVCSGAGTCTCMPGDSYCLGTDTYSCNGVDYEYTGGGCA
jgi:hypothetical protein